MSKIKGTCGCVMAIIRILKHKNILECEHNVIQEQYLIKCLAILFQVKEWLQRTVPQIGQKWYTTQFRLVSRCENPSRGRWCFGDLLCMCFWVQNNRFPSSQIAQFLIEFS